MKSCVSFAVVIVAVVVTILSIVDPVIGGGGIRGRNLEVDENDQTDSPAESLLDLVFLTESPTEEIYKSLSPTLSPTIALTDTPTELPSTSPTVSSTTASPTLISMNVNTVTTSPTIDPLLNSDYGYNNMTVVPTNDIDGLPVNEDSLVVEESSPAPTFSPTKPFTNEPTESPSSYPTTAPTTNFITGLDDDVLLDSIQ
jgi:hypothetical protein